jgi:hypothetical protein
MRAHRREPVRAGAIVLGPGPIAALGTRMGDIAVEVGCFRVVASRRRIIGERPLVEADAPGGPGPIDQSLDVIGLEGECLCVAPNRLRIAPTLVHGIAEVVVTLRCAGPVRWRARRR